MTDKILPALQRLETALREAQKVTQQIAQIMQTAEQDAAAPFRGGAAGGGAGRGAGGPVTGIPPRDYALMSQAAYSDSLPPELAAKGWQNPRYRRDGRRLQWHRLREPADRRGGDRPSRHRSADAGFRQRPR